MLFVAFLRSETSFLLPQSLPIEDYDYLFTPYGPEMVINQSDNSSPLLESFVPL